MILTTLAGLSMSWERRSTNTSGSREFSALSREEVEVGRVKKDGERR